VNLQVGESLQRGLACQQQVNLGEKSFVILSLWILLILID